MLARCSKQELIIVGLIVVTGIVLRAGRTDLLAVEHFDEGVYTSSQWYAGDGGYPATHLYAPPMLSWMISVASWVPGLERVAPFVPGIVLGSGFVLLMWLAARSWFGLVGGLCVASVVAMNDLHILLREATWNYFMGRREYYANKRTAIAAGEWYEDVPGTAAESVFSGWFKKVRAGGEQARESGSKDKRGAAESEWTDNPAKMTTSQDGEEGLVKI